MSIERGLPSGLSFADLSWIQSALGNVKETAEGWEEVNLECRPGPVSETPLGL